MDRDTYTPGVRAEVDCSTEPDHRFKVAKKAAVAAPSFRDEPLLVVKDKLPPKYDARTLPVKGKLVFSPEVRQPDSSILSRTGLNSTWTESITVMSRLKSFIWPAPRENCDLTIQCCAAGSTVHPWRVSDEVPTPSPDAELFSKLPESLPDEHVMSMATPASVALN
jgi:hypothetical protein